MRTLAFTFNINGAIKKVALRKKVREPKYQVIINGDVLEYAFTGDNQVEQIDGPVLAETDLQGQIERMLLHYFGKNQR
jgi:hypothetical protein